MKGRSHRLFRNAKPVLSALSVSRADDSEQRSMHDGGMMWEWTSPPTRGKNEK